MQGVRPAAATAYDPGRARWGAPPALGCARLSEQHTIKPLDGGTPAKATALGAAQLDDQPFCGMQKQSNYTLSFAQVECGKAYIFTSKAAATPTTPDAQPVTAELVFNVTC